MTVEEIRAELPVLDRLAYLNTGTFGPLPRRTTEVMVAEHLAELEHGRSGAAYWERSRAVRARVREGLARLVNAESDHLALMRSTTDGCNVAVAGLRLGQDDEIVTTDCEHFGLLGALAASGARVRVASIRNRTAAEALDAVEAELSPRTRLIAISHVVWNTGQVMPVRELSGRGIPVLVDGAQGAGAIPVDVRALGCDFYTVSGQKWLLGPDGTGALYVAPQRIDEHAVAFPSYYAQVRHGPDGAYEPTAGAPRLDVGTIAIPSLSGLEQSIELAESLGAERFRRARALAERCRELVGLQAEVVTEADQATLVTFRPPGDAARVVTALTEAGVVVREMPGLGWVRASVGFWTSDDDLERLVQALP